MDLGKKESKDRGSGEGQEKGARRRREGERKRVSNKEMWKYLRASLGWRLAVVPVRRQAF
jgi:hypothetical protein